MIKPKIGIQLYSVREALAEDFKGTLIKLSKLGFRGVEFAYNYGGMEPSELADFLKKGDLPRSASPVMFRCVHLMA